MLSLNELHKTGPCSTQITWVILTYKTTLIKSNLGINELRVYRFFKILEIKDRRLNKNTHMCVVYGAQMTPMKYDSCLLA